MVTVVIIIGIPSAYIRRSFWSPLRVMPSFIVLLYKAQIPLRRFCDKVWDKFPTKSQTCRGHKSWKSATQITSPTFMICVADFHDLCSPTLSPTFPVHCNGLNSIRATQTGLSRTCHGLYRKHLNMSRWFVSMTFPAGKFRWKSA